MGVGYDPLKILCTAGGILITNLDKEAMVSIAYDGADAVLRETTHGDAIFSIRRVTTATVTITLEPSSNGHALFSSFLQRQRLTGGGQFVFTITDVNVPDGGAVFTSTAARIAQPPDISYASEAQSVAYTILCGQVTHVMGAIPSQLLPL